MNIFNYLSSLLFTKKNIEINEFDMQGEYQPYLINRWGSMLNSDIAKIINYTSNTLFPILDRKIDHYRFLKFILPQSRYSKIKYIKKNKQTTDNDAIVTKISKNVELSKREVNLYIQQLNIDLNKYDNKKSKH